MPDISGIDLNALDDNDFSTVLEGLADQEPRWAQARTSQREAAAQSAAETAAMDAASDRQINDWAEQNRDDAAKVDSMAAVIVKAKTLGLSASEIQALEQLPIESPQAQKAFESAIDLVISASQRRTTGLQSLLDKRIARLEAGLEDEDDEVDSDESETDESEEDQDAEDLNDAEDPDGDELDTEDETEDAGATITTAKQFIAALSKATSLEDQVALVEALAASAAPAPSDSDETAMLRAELELAQARAAHPRAAAAMQQLSQTQSVTEYAAALEELLAGREIPVPSVDPNNPARTRQIGLSEALASGQMNDEIADVVINGYSKR